MIKKFDRFINEGSIDFIEFYYLIEYQARNYFIKKDEKRNKSNSDVSSTHQYLIKSISPKEAEDEFKKIWNDEASGYEPAPDLEILNVSDVSGDIQKNGRDSFDNYIKLY